MKRLTLLVMPLMTLSFLTSCNKNGPKTYTVTWLNDDGTQLKVDTNVEDGTIPVYEDETHSTPIKEPDTHIYRFKGWEPEVKEIHSDTVYTATYYTITNAQFCARVEMTEDSQTFEFTDVSTTDEFVIDWGDGVNSSQNASYEHTYAKKGIYSIVIKTESLSNFTISDSSKKFVKTAYLGSSINSISDSAFSNCSDLTFIDIPSAVTSIGSSAFEGCSKLTNINIPNSVTSIGSSAFKGCSSLASSINIPSGVTSISNSAFEGCSKLTNINIPNSVTSIGSSAFEGCSSLTNINIPNSVTYIAGYVFNHCSNLISVNILGNVTSIGMNTFGYCSSLKEVTIPNSVISIEVFAFVSCWGLKKVYLTTFITDNIPSCDSRAFHQCSPIFYVASEEMANKFKEKGGGWPTDIGKYHWPGKSE